ncbi:MAG TPA: protein-disulfide reductase DsbD domain-containing protein [Terriglobales bacterium]|nr:protein-disulfide reductase DsbD domain-containing protein [Terriglobales bacterium]
MTLLRRRSIVLLTACAMLAAAARSNAQLPAEPHLKVELISEQATSAPGQPLWVGVLFRLEPGWHIYWQNPGDSGESPRVQWNLPTGFVAGSIRWPQPIRLGGGSVVDYGYEGQVLLMAPIQAPSSRNATSLQSLSADLKYIVCRDVCIPGKAHITLSGPAAGDWDPWRALFEQTRAQLPKPAPASWKVTALSAKQHFVLSVQARSQLTGASFFPLEPSQIDNSSPQEFAPTHNGFRLTLKKSDQITKQITNLRGLIVLGPGHAFEVSAPVVSR